MREMIIHNKKDYKERKKRLKKEKLEKEKQQLEHIKELLEEKNYDEIFKVYGIDAYYSYVPKKYIKEDLKKLLKMGNFEDMYTKLGDDYGNYINKMKNRDILFNTNKKSKVFLNSINYRTKKMLPNISLLAFYFLTVYDFKILESATYFGELIAENAEKYATEISMYDEKIKEYAKIFDGVNLTDLQVIMKVIDDMWNSISAYGNPKLDVYGYDRLAFLEDNAEGVCRNMANDVCAKLNFINPDYNARTLVVKMSGGGSYANIEQKVNYDNYPSPSNNQDSYINLYGNHEVVMMDVPNDNLTLIIDPTNPSVGIFRNGQIYMFSNEDGKCLTVELLSTTMNGVSFVRDYRMYKIKSFFDNHVDIETLRKKYGLEAQNEALDYVRNMFNGKQMTK